MRRLRIAVQILCLLRFLHLLLITTYPLASTPPVDVFVRLDPLALLTVSLAGRIWAGWVFWPAILVLILTALFGRWFCGWVCPLGTTIDISDKLIAPRYKFRESSRHLRTIKYWILFGILGAALFGFQLVGLFDPITIAIRGYGLALFSYADRVVRPFVLKSETLYDWLMAPGRPILAPETPVFLLSLLFLAVFVGVLLLSRYENRFWCKNLCPLGALLSVVSRFSLYRRWINEETCTRCGRCEPSCKSGQRSPRWDNPQDDSVECMFCWNCVSACPHGSVHFGFSPKKRPEQVARGPEMSRRALLTSLGTGVLLAPVLAKTGQDARAAGVARLIRPPGALAEDEFLDRCIRCGECMKVCPTNFLQPVLLEGGLAALWTPKGVPQIGFCEYTCIECGKVCASGAIQRLTEEEKHDVRIGLAHFDRNRCIPWAEHKECLVCEEHCPVTVLGKAIQVRDEQVVDFETGETVTVGLPYVVRERCVGCGTCENVCPLGEEPGVIVTTEVETRDPEKMRAFSGDSEYG